MAKYKIIFSFFIKGYITQKHLKDMMILKNLLKVG